MRPFVLFDPIHLATLAVTCIIIIVATYWIKHLDGHRLEHARVSLGVLLLVHLFMQLFNSFSYGLPWQESIPLHMCDLSKLTIALFLLGYGKKFFFCGLFWGTIPAIMALLTPALRFTFPDAEFVNFYYGHGLIILGVSVSVFALNQSPTFRDFLWLVQVTLALTVILFFINHLLGEGANFWYLKDKPPGDTIMNYFPDAPYHLIALIPVAIFAFFLTYLPFLMKGQSR